MCTVVMSGYSENKAIGRLEDTLAVLCAIADDVNDPKDNKKGKAILNMSFGNAPTVHPAYQYKFRACRPVCLFFKKGGKRVEKG